MARSVAADSLASRCPIRLAARRARDMRSPLRGKGGGRRGRAWTRTHLAPAGSTQKRRRAMRRRSPSTLATPCTSSGGTTPRSSRSMSMLAGTRSPPPPTWAGLTPPWRLDFLFAGVAGLDLFSSTKESTRETMLSTVDLPEKRPAPKIKSPTNKIGQKPAFTNTCLAHRMQWGGQRRAWKWWRCWAKQQCDKTWFCLP